MLENSRRIARLKIEERPMRSRCVNAVVDESDEIGKHGAYVCARFRLSSSTVMAKVTTYAPAQAKPFQRLGKHFIDLDKPPLRAPRS